MGLFDRALEESSIRIIEDKIIGSPIMKKARKKAVRSLSIRIRLTPQEYSLLTGRQQASTCPSLSHYVRQMNFRRRIIKTTRNLSEDAMMDALSRIQRELERIGVYNPSLRSIDDAEINELIKLLDELNQQIKHQWSYVRTN